MLLQAVEAFVPGDVIVVRTPPLTLQPNSRINRHLSFPSPQVHGVVRLMAPVVLPAACVITGANMLSSVQVLLLLLLLLLMLLLLTMISTSCATQALALSSGAKASYCTVCSCRRRWRATAAAAAAVVAAA